MALELKQNMKMSQQLRMTPQLQQAIKLLQLSRLELAEMIQGELVENPVLEDGEEEIDRADLKKNAENSNVEDKADPETKLAEKPEKRDGEMDAHEEGSNGEVDWDAYLEHYASAPTAPASPVIRDKDAPSFEATLTREESLQEHLLWQLRMQEFSDEEELAGVSIIGNIDPNGYLRDVTIEEIADANQCSLEAAVRVLDRIQHFDPIGCAARSLQECLLIQARSIGQDDHILIQMIRKHMDLMERKRYDQIARALGQPVEEIIEAVKVISSLDPKPGRAFTLDEPRYITPDVYIHKLSGEYYVVPNDDGMPRLRISKYYRKALNTKGDDKQYIQDKLRSAHWLIRSIQQRQRTIIKVTESIIKFQKEFLEQGVQHIRPLVLREVADDIGMHESTVSRVTTNKYVHTPQGIYELKYFFNSRVSRMTGSDVSSQSVKNMINEIIADENPKKPLSDQKLVEMLRLKDIDIARRTVTKYREQMRILSSSKRKQLY